MERFTGEVIIYGGAFNPPTLAHTAITRACVEYARSRGAQVWLLPSGTRHDKSIAVSRDQRIAYMRAMVRDVATPQTPIVIRTDELDRSNVTETYDTVIDFMRRYPAITFTWVFGADSYATMRQWKQGGWLADSLRILLFNRIGTPEIMTPPSPNVTVLSMATPPVSSTLVRTTLQEGGDISSLVGAHVKDLLVTRR